MSSFTQKLKLRGEELEDRRLLAVYTVSNLNDSGSGSLRETLEMANRTAEHDTIEIDSPVLNGTIQLTSGELTIISDVTIVGPHDGNVVIDAGLQSGVVNLQPTLDDQIAVTMSNLTIRGASGGVGGAIVATGQANLSLVRVKLINNATTAINFDSHGSLSILNSEVASNEGSGIVSRGALTIESSTIRSNLRSGVLGAEFVGSPSILVKSSRITDNGELGIQNSFGSIDVADSEISRNASGIASYFSGFTVANSTIAHNGELGVFGFLGADRNPGIIEQSTISGHSVSGVQLSCSTPGGFAPVEGTCPLTIANSTITGNSKGVYTASDRISYDIFGYTYTFEHLAETHLESSIVAGNDSNDLVMYGSHIGGGIYSRGHNVIGFGDNGEFTLEGDQTEIADPMLSPLQSNGGFAATHLPLSGSPVIDAGDASAVAGVNGVPLSDQRGPSFVRVLDGDGDGVARLDIGAVELLPIDVNDDGANDAADIDAILAGISSGNNDLRYDLDQSGSVDYDDVLEWLRQYGTTPGDANLDRTVDGRDFVIWNSNKFQSTGSWALADFDGNGSTDGGDFIVWNDFKFDVQLRSGLLQNEMRPKAERELESVFDLIWPTARLSREPVRA